jgi:hypothetical protein
MLIKQMSGYNVRIGHPLGMLSCQDIEGINETTAATSAGLIQAAIEDECMNCAIYDETIHTEIETVVEGPAQTEDTMVEIEEEALVENVPVEEVPVEEDIEEESYPEEEEEEDEELEEELDQEDEAQEDEDDDYDEELDEDYEDRAKPAKKAGKGENGGLFRKFKIIWNKLNDDTDNWIEGMSKK